MIDYPTTILDPVGQRKAYNPNQPRGAGGRWTGGGSNGGGSASAASTSRLEHTHPLDVNERMGYIDGHGHGVKGASTEDIAARSGGKMTPTDVMRWQRSWTNSTASDKSTALQQAISERFGVPMAPAHVVTRRDQMASENPEHWQGMVADAHVYLQAQYEVTQEALRKAGVTRINVTRGWYVPPDRKENALAAVGREPRDITYIQGPARSWTFSQGKATEFARTGMGTELGWAKESKGYLIAATVPASRVLSVPQTGDLGNIPEQEVVVLGGPLTATAIQVR